MIAGYHLIWTVYGWWLPNDPRGSTSREVHAASIASLGDLHYGRKRVQPSGREIREFREAARGVLKHPLLELSLADTNAVGQAFAETARTHSYTCYGCAILSDHVHVLIRKHRDQAETMIAALQDSSRISLRQAGTRAADHPVWGGPGWKVYLETREDMQRTIAYILKNLMQARRTEQMWPFVKPYDGWLPGQVRIAQAADRPA